MCIRDSNKTVIKTVDDLLAFSKAVNNGDYDKNKDAVVVLENDLDLTGVVWKMCIRDSTKTDTPTIWLRTDISLFYAKRPTRVC